MKKFLSLVLALVMTMSLVTISAGAKDFTDNDKLTYSDAVAVMSAVKVIDGYTDGSFKPTTQLNRGQAAKILCNMILGPTTASALKADAAPFKDVAADNTFAGYIAFCTKEGIIDGYTDGTFKPTAPLTGYAFMKFLLGALGYDKDVEGYNGANWSINVAKQALAIGLEDGLNEEFDGTKYVTREEACLYAFNTLQAEMVQYSDKTQITTGDVTVITTGNRRVRTDVPRNEKIKDDGKLQFAEEYFEKLAVVPTTDAFERPASKWSYDNKKVTTVVDDATVTYTDKEKIKDIYSDIGQTSTELYYVYTDGVYTGTQAINKNSTTKLGAASRAAEYYYDADDANYRTLVYVNTYIEQIIDVDKNDDDERVVKIYDPVTGQVCEYVTEDFEEDDWVLYTVDADAASQENVIQSMTKVEKQTGRLTKAVNTEDKLTIGGETYKKAWNIAFNANVDVNDDVDFYLDSNGYVIKVDEADDNASVANLAYVVNAGAHFDAGWARLVFADGTSKVVETDKNYSAAPNMVKSIVTFKEKDGEYKLTEKADFGVQGATSTNLKFENGKPAITNNAGVNVTRTDSKTAFVLVVNDSGTLRYRAYTGFKAAPSMLVTDGSANVTAFVKTGKSVATMVVIELNAADLRGSSANLLFLANKSSMDYVEESTSDTDTITYYEFKAIKGRELTTVRIDASDAVLANTVSVLNNVSFDSDNLGDWGTVPTTSTNPYGAAKDYYTSTTVEREGNDKINVDTLGALYNLTFTDDVKVFEVDEDKITEGTIRTIREDNDGTKDPYATIYYTLDDGMVDLVILELN